MLPSPGVPERHCHHVHNLQWVRLCSSMSLYIETSQSFSTFARSWFSKRSSSLWKATTDSWPMRVLLGCWFATLRHYRPVCVPIWEWFFSWSLFSRLYFLVLNTNPKDAVYWALCMLLGCTGPFCSGTAASSGTLARSPSGTPWSRWAATTRHTARHTAVMSGFVPPMLQLFHFNLRL